MTPEELQSAILDTLADYEAAHRRAFETADHFRDIDQELDSIKLRLLDDIHATLKDGKPAFSNDEKRKAELTKRLGFSYLPILKRHAAAEKAKRDAAAELERLDTAMRAYRTVAALQNVERDYEAASLRLRAAQLDHHSLPTTSLPVDFPTA